MKTALTIGLFLFAGLANAQNFNEADRKKDRAYQKLKEKILFPCKNASPGQFGARDRP